MNSTTHAAFFDELCKIAAASVDVVTDPASVVTDTEVAPVHKEHPLLTAAKGIGGFALGAGVGFTGAHLADRAIKRLGGDGVPLSVIRYGAPIAGAAAGLGFNVLQHKMTQRMKDYWSPSSEVPNGFPQNTAR